MREDVMNAMLREKDLNKRSVILSLAGDYDLTEEQIIAVIWDYLGTERGYKAIEVEIENVLRGEGINEI